MKIFGYGSLMCANSFKKTMPNFKELGTGILPGYKRVFNFKSPYRKNKKTGLYSSVLNLIPDEEFDVFGVVYDIDEKNLKSLSIREAGYVLKEVALKEGGLVWIYVAEDNVPYNYVENDPIQQEYLDICIEASKVFGEEFLNNFLESTFIKNKPIKERFTK